MKNARHCGNGVAHGVMCARKTACCCTRTKNKETVLDSAAMHLCNQNEHTEFNDFNIARDCVTEGLTQMTKKTLAYYDEHGEEQRECPQAQAKKRPTPPSTQPTEHHRKAQKVQSRRESYQNPNQNNKERSHRRQDTEVIGARASQDRHAGRSRDQNEDAQRSRTSRARLRSVSRTRRRSRSRGTSNRQDNQIALGPPPTWSVIGTQSVPFQIRAGPRDHEVTIGRVELDQITDALTRASAAANACMLWMRQFGTAADNSFRAEEDCMDTCRATLLRFSRA